MHYLRNEVGLPVLSVSSCHTLSISHFLRPVNGLRHSASPVLRQIRCLPVEHKWIQRAKELPTDPTEVSKDDRDKIRYVLADIYKDPEKTTAANLKEFLTPEYERAIVTVGQNMSEAAEKIDESFRDLPEHQRRAWLNDTRTFTLDKMAEMVNTAVSLEKEQEKEQEKELQSGSVQSVL